ncbi:MAG: DUF190 domain-containing protein [Dehalococcoides mccartyi]|uniref:DUF190 domain-containing protein n=1 Tax=Dehalococcoides TaxID=61434 RepID=UPI002737A379|nr:DUF190 domain-containing protein [Dehalococcoides mccartyi]MDP4279696.1 DUF190 domain-containing protein [Dehalococcoides mccartyi]
MRKLNGESALIRIFIGESDKYQGKPLYQALVEMLRQEKIAGTTVLRGIMGFGAGSHLHTAHILRLSQDMPIVVEAVDSQENIDRILPEVEKMMGDGLITLEKVKVLKYAAGQQSPD